MFVWGYEQQKTFNEIKEYMNEPPVLVPPQLNKPFKLYVAADTQTIGSALIQEFEALFVECRMHCILKI
jgi:hypothetical protein